MRSPSIEPLETRIAPAAVATLSGPAQVVEGNSGSQTVTYTVSLSEVSATNVTVGYTSYSQGAGFADDYYFSESSVTIPAGSLSATFDVTVYGDRYLENDEAFAMSLTGIESGSAVVGDPNYVATTILDDDMPAISVGDISAAEGPNAYATFTVHVSVPVDDYFYIRYGTLSGTATSGSDYAGVDSSQILTFEPYETDKVVSVQLIDDIFHEQPETFSLHVFFTSFGYIAKSDGVATIYDNDPAPVVSIVGPGGPGGSVSLDEGDSSRSHPFTLNLDRSSGTPITVHLSTYDNGPHAATAGIDYVPIDRDVTFAPGETSKSVSLTVNGDTADEFDEALGMIVVGVSGEVVVPAMPTSVILRNDDVRIVVSDAQVIEGNAGVKHLNFTVALSGPSEHSVSLSYFTATGTASSPQDFLGLSGALAFDPGETVKTISVDVAGDVDGEADEYFVLNFSEVQHASINKTSVRGTILSDDAYVSISDAQVVESGPATSKTMLFTVSLVNATGSVTLNYRTVDGTAMAGVDYVAISSGALNFAVGETSKTIAVRVLGDANDEVDETFRVELSNVVGMDPTGSKLSGTGTIIDDESLLMVSDATLTEGDFGTQNMVFTVRLLNRVSNGVVAVNFATADGTAVGGVDYTSVSGTLIFGSSETSKTITVPIRGDLVREGSETYALNFSNPSGASLAMAKFTGTIVDDDPLPVFSIGGGNLREDGGELVFTVSLSGASSSPVTVDFSTANGTASSSSDYAATFQTLTFAPGQTVTTVTVPIAMDSLIEGDETVLGNLSNAHGAAIGIASVVGVIHEDDILVSLSASDLATPATEGDNGTTLKSIAVNLSSPALPGHPVVVDFSIISGSAVVGTDFLAPTIHTLVFAPGESSKEIQIQIRGDTIDEDAEQFFITLSTPTNASLANASASVVTIADDDAAPSISIADANLIEGNSGQSAMNFTVSLSAPSVRAISVVAKTNAGTAGLNTDFFGLNQLVTFQPGETTKTISVAIVGDTTDELTETFAVELSAAVDATLADAVAIGTILDNDLRSVSVSDVTASEGDLGTKVFHFTVALSAPATQTINLFYSTEDDTAKAGSDYQSNTGFLTFFPFETAKTVDVVVNGDAVLEANEFFFLRLQSSDAEPHAIIADGVGVGTIQNDETLFSLGDSVVVADEDGPNGGDNTVAFTIHRTGDLSLPGAVTVSTVDGVAKSTGDRADFIAQTSAVTFAPGESAKSFFVTLKHDLNYETDETFQVTLSDAAGGNGTVDLARHTQSAVIVNNDVRPVVMVTDAPATTEGGLSSNNRVNFTVKLVAPDGTVVSDEVENVVVSYHTIDGTARSEDNGVFLADFAPVVAGALTLNKGEAVKAISIPVHGDGVDENDETLYLQIDSAAPGAGLPLGIVRGLGKGTVLDDDEAPVVVFSGSSPSGGYSIPEGTVGDSSFHPNLELLTGVSGSPTYSEKDITFTLTLVPGTATPGTDYLFPGPNTKTITIPAGESLHALDLTILADAIYEADETFSLAISEPHNVKVSVPVSQVTIGNDDLLPTLAISSPTLVERDAGQTNMVFTVALQGVSDHTVTVNYATADGAGAAGAKSVGGLPDFAATAGVFSFAPGETSKLISVPIFGDAWMESDETFTVSLSNATHAAILTGTGIGTIYNGADSVVGLVVQDAASVEDPFTVGSDGTTTQVSNPTINFRVELTKAVDTNVTFLATTRNGTAVATGFSDSDFVAPNGTLVTIPAGQMTVTVPVTIKTDFNASTQNGVFEPTENFFLGIGGISNNAGAARAEGRGTILNDDFQFVDAKTLRYIDEDGDLATLKITKGTLAAASITFGRVNQSTGGRTLQLLDFTGNPKLFNGTSVSLTAAPQDGFAANGRTTDGRVDVGFIRGGIPDTELLQWSKGIDFGSIAVQGDVGRITAGDSVKATPAIAGKVSVQSLGARGLENGAPSNTSQFYSTVNALNVAGDVKGIVQVLGNLTSLKIGGALRGAATVYTVDDAPSGVIAFTGTLGSATIGEIIGGGARDSGSIVGYADSTAKIGSLHVLGDIVGGKGTRSGSISVKTIGSVVVDGSLIGGGDNGFDFIAGNLNNTPKGSNSGVIRASASIGKVQIGGDVQGGIQSTTGLIVAGSTVNSVHLGGSLLGGSGATDSGAIVVGQNLTTLTIDGDVIGSSGQRSGTVQVGTAQNLNTTLSFPIFIKNLTVGRVNGSGGDLRGGSGVDSGTITSGAGFDLSSFVVRGGTIGNALIYGDLVGGTGTGGTSSRAGDGSGGVQAGSTITKLDIRGSIIGGDSPGATLISSAADLTRSGFVLAGRIAQMIVGGDLVAGRNFGNGLADSGSIRARYDIASLVIRGDVIGNETNAAVISAGGNGPVVNGKASPAIGSLTLGSSTTNSVSFLHVLAGYGPTGRVSSNYDPDASLGDKLTADVQIGTVSIMGDMKATNIVAGADRGVDGSFGTSDDFAFTASSYVANNAKILSSIAKVVVGGSILAADGTYGIVAQQVSFVSGPAGQVPLSSRAGSDFVEVASSTGLFVREVAV